MPRRSAKNLQFTAVICVYPSVVQAGYKVFESGRGARHLRRRQAPSASADRSHLLGALLPPQAVLPLLPVSKKGDINSLHIITQGGENSQLSETTISGFFLRFLL